MASKKTPKKKIILRNFQETATEKRNEKLSDLQNEIANLKLELKNLTERVAALESAED